MNTVMDGCCNLAIETLFEAQEETGIHIQHYREVLQDILQRILPPEFFEEQQDGEATRSHQKKLLKHLIPLITHTELSASSGNVSFYSLAKCSPNSFKFFYEMISRWLLPGKRLNVILVCASDFRLPELTGDELYTICEVIVKIESRDEFRDIQKQFPLIGNEITLGINSIYHAQRILEIKGLSADEKTAMIQSFMTYLMKRLPQNYEMDVLNEMQHLLVVCREEFKAPRQARHLSRIIASYYLFRKHLRESLEKNSSRRYLHLKLFRSSIQTAQGSKRVLGVLVCVNLLKELEVFGERHLLKAIQHYIPNANLVEHSVFSDKVTSENFCTIYLEVEKPDGEAFSLGEIKRLRRELPTNLKNRIEYKVHPIFMPRNEEEVMRNLIVLADQVRYLRDIPQVFITFDEQAQASLYFTIILARVLKSDSCRIQELFRRGDSPFDYIHDRIKIVGYLRKRYPKEVTVFRLKLPKEMFLRTDHSIDLYKARHAVVAELERVLGEVRDFNGGMISKQHELLSDIRKLVADVRGCDEWLLENFFYSLSPVVMRSFVDPQAFKTLLLMLLEGINEYNQESYYLKFNAEPYHLYALVVAEDPHVKELLQNAVHELHISSSELASASTTVNGNTCLGYICWAQDPYKKEQLMTTINNTLQERASSGH